MPKKLTYEFVKSEIEKEGYKLLSNKYVNDYSKLKFICSNGHKHHMSYDNFRSGRRCVYCSSRPPISYDDVKEEFEKFGYTLLSKEYINNEVKLDFLCPNGHKHTIAYHSFKSGIRCAYCSNSPPVSCKEVKKIFELEGYILLSKEYFNNKTKLDYICPKGHQHSIKWTHWQQGARCSICSMHNKKGKNNSNWRGGGDVAWYNTHAHKVDFAEEIRRASDDKNILEVKCTYCGGWFRPKRSEVCNRIVALNGGGSGDHHFYCSNNCKKACPIYNQKKYPKGFKPATSREVQPELRQMVLARDNYECQICHKNQQDAELHCHHITGVVQNPLESADVDNCITLCKKHHKEVHKLPRCNYNDLKCKEN